MAEEFAASQLEMIHAVYRQLAVANSQRARKKPKRIPPLRIPRPSKPEKRKAVNTLKDLARKLGS